MGFEAEDPNTFCPADVEEQQLQIVWYGGP